MPYHVGDKGSYGCSGYPALKDDDDSVMGCHDTAEEAAAQIAAIEAKEKGVGIKNPEEWPGTAMKAATDKDGMGSAIGQPEPASKEKSAIKDPKKKPKTSVGGAGGDSTGAISTTNGGSSMGTKGDVQKDCWDGYTARGMKPGANGNMVPNCVPTSKSDDLFEDEDDVEYDDTIEMMFKAETFTPNDGMKSAARRALKWKADGKATGAGTPVGWGRATDIVAGRAMSLSTVRRMFSFFSRHEQASKGGKDFNNTSNPSNGRIMWDAWGGNAGFSWSRGIVNRMRDKALFSDFGKDFTTTTSLSTIFKSIGVGSMVSWNSSGGTAKGKITRIIRSGTYNVPGTEVSLNASEDDPVAVIRLYRDGEPTDTVVAHKTKTLRQS